MQFIPVMAKLNFQLSNIYYFLSMLKMVVLLNIFVETVICFFSGFFDKQKVTKNNTYLK